MADVAVVGSGPNGLAAAVVMARAGLSVRVYEAAEALGGGARTAELLEPGHLYDVCSAVHPMALASPFFRAFGLEQRVELRLPEVQYGTPLDGGRAALAYRSLERTVAELGADGPAFGRLMRPLVERVEGMLDVTQNQLLRVPRDPLAALRLGLATLSQGGPWWNRRFAGEEAPALLTGAAAHAVGALPSLVPAGAGLMLSTLAHVGGWPVPVGGSGAIVDAMVRDIEAHGGVFETGVRVRSLDELRPARAVLLDVAPPELLGIAGDALEGATGARYRRALEAFRFGNAACKVDLILSGPVPWAAPGLAAAGTVHVGGTRAEMAAAENEVAAGRHPAKPYVLVAQPSVVDPGRAPAGRHILWTYCHVPAGSTVDVSAAVTDRIEAFAPGFRDVVVDWKTTTAAGLAAYNPNYVGGDFGAGAMNVPGLLRRPVVSTVPWRTPLAGVYLCSSSTPPGPGVTGMAGFHAARHALKDVFGVKVPELGPA
ncbi:dehydrogenase [Arthrobacter sp. SW1]|uniref:phytoene desaturase family protein n=1 Tax=Arthrobacter sp. SW1 TaxID=1920889 RepID=UPI000877D76F|nr:NAD(P)/FAD-dependent oxidoreductase [Arthrobacter sp. SW1]OFI36490.1 dehydrogenase [Arthrobacter sp. SW1]